MKFSLKAILTLCFLISFSSSESQAQSPSQTRLQSQAQSHENRLRISLLTCGPADELYSVWGHTAIRVIDSSTGNDIVFNYGTFDVSDGLFYLKFTRGIMRYALSVEDFEDFLQEYKDDRRSVIEQTLQLNAQQKQTLVDLLKTNATEENRYYNYSFYEDNCTTRAKAIIQKSTGNNIIFKNSSPGKPATYRQLFHQNLDSWRQYWSKFGIDLLLGSNLDKTASYEQSMFLPDNLMNAFDSASLEQHPLIGEKDLLLKAANQIPNASIFNPLNIFWALAVIFITLTISKDPKAKNILQIADGIFFLTIGFLGIILCFVWLGRVDTVCSNNLNLLWAWPTHTIAVFLKRPKQIYFRLASIIAILTLIAWAWLPQQLNPAFIPLLLIIIVRGLNPGLRPGFRKQ